MKIKQVLFLLLLICLNHPSPAVATDDPVVDDDVRSLMHQFLGEFQQLQPYLVSSDKFQEEQSKKAVGRVLSDLVKRTNKTAPTEIGENENFRLTFRLLKDHFEKTQKVFENKEYEYARIRLNGTINFCISCHTQMPVSKGWSGSLGLAKEPSLELAEFAFLVRRFDEGLAMYDKLVRSYPKYPLTEEQLYQIYRRKIAIFARVKRDAETAVTNLNEDLKNKALPDLVRVNIRNWVKKFEEWKNEEFNFEKASDKDLIAYAKKEIPENFSTKMNPQDAEVIPLLRVSSYLYERLHQNKRSDFFPEFLYYLAACEKQISSVYWYSVEDSYLKECVQKYPKSKMKTKCFNAYKESVASRYTGGVIPDYIQKSIDSLKQNL